MFQTIWPDEHIECQICFEYSEKFVSFGVCLLEFNFKFPFLNVYISGDFLRGVLEHIKGTSSALFFLLFCRLVLWFKLVEVKVVVLALQQFQQGLFRADICQTDIAAHLCGKTYFTKGRIFVFWIVEIKPINNLIALIVIFNVFERHQLHHGKGEKSVDDVDQVTCKGVVVGCQGFQFTLV